MPPVDTATGGTEDDTGGATVAEANSLNSKSSSVADTGTGVDISIDGDGADTGTNDGCCIKGDACGC